MGHSVDCVTRMAILDRCNMNALRAMSRIDKVSHTVDPFKVVNVSLTKRQKDFVHEKVRSGNYQSASEVVREALRVLETLESENNSLEEQILEGIESGPAKPVTKAYWNKFKSRLHREREHRQRKAA